MAPRTDLGMDPIQQREQKLQRAMGVLVELYPNATLSLFVIDAGSDGPTKSHISNADPRQFLAVIKAWVVQQEGQLDG